MRSMWMYRLANARDRAERLHYGQPIFIGQIQDFAEENLLNLSAKILLKDGGVYLLEYPLTIHQNTIGALGFTIAQAFIRSASRLSSE
jgi:hypothetical protein